MWKLRHAAWTVLHDTVAHPVCGILWAINHSLSNRIGYWLHDITLPETWQQDKESHRIPA